MGVAAVIWNPVGALREAAEGRRVLAGFVVVAAYASLGLISSTAFVLSGATRRQFEQQPLPPELPPGFVDAVVRVFEIGLPVSALLSPFLLWIATALLMQLATRLFGGSGPLSAMLAAVGVAQVPVFLSGVLGLLLGLAQLAAGAGTPVEAVISYLINIIGLAFFFWYVVLVVIGAAVARNVGYGESAGACAISCVGFGILIILLAVVVGIGIAIAAGAAVPQ